MDQHFLLFLKVDVCLLTTVLGQALGPGTEEMEHVVGGPWGVGGVLGGEAGVEAEHLGDGFHGEAVGVS